MPPRRPIANSVAPDPAIAPTADDGALATLSIIEAELSTLTARRDRLAEELEILTRTRSAMHHALEAERRQAQSVEDRVIARALAGAMTDLVSLHDDAGTMIYCSPSVEQALGFDHAELASMRIAELLAPEDLQRLTTASRFAAENAGQISPLVDIRIRRKDGRTLWLETRIARVMDGERDLLLVVSRDISKRMAAEAALVEHRRWTDQLIEHSELGIYRADVEGRFVWVNPALVQMLGYDSANELYGVQIRDAVYETPAERERLLERTRDDGRLGRFDVRWRRRDGTPIMVRMIARLVHDEHGALAYCEAIVEDVTERLRAETSQRRAERMASLGRMLAGVAHELNNPLAAICGFAQLVQRTALGAEDRAALETIEREGQRAARIVRELLNFSRHDGEVTLAPVNVAEILHYVANTQRYAMETRGIQCVLDAPDAGLWVDGDRFHLEQIVVNLLVNARQALEEVLDTKPTRSSMSGTTCPAVAMPTITLRAWRSGDTAHVEVRDTGPGIAPRDLSRIWDPFFTTKPDGVGTGLGLSVVHTTITSMGGTIEAESAPGEGAAFRITLPASSAPAPTAAPARGAIRGAVPHPAPAAGGGSQPRDILVVGSGQATTRFITRYLGERGHAVVAVATIEEATTLLANTPFEVVVVNLTSPRAAFSEVGAAAVTRLRGARGGEDAHLVLAMRGADEQIRRMLEQWPRVAVLDRPTDVDALRRLVEGY